MSGAVSLKPSDVSYIKSPSVALLTVGFLVFGMGVSLGVTGLASNPNALPWWLGRTVTDLGTFGCSTLLCGGYIVGHYLVHEGLKTAKVAHWHLAEKEFNEAVHFLEHLPTTYSKELPKELRFALNILNKVALDGADWQKKVLWKNKDRIKKINLILSSIKEFEGLQVNLPQSSCSSLLETMTRIPRALISVAFDIAMLPLAGLLLAIAACRSKEGGFLDPKPENVKKDKTPILFIHGSSFNEMEWALAPVFLKKEYGSAFSLNYDGLASNPNDRGIDDYAEGKVMAKIEAIFKQVNERKIILVGHSMGGLIATRLATLAQKYNFKVEHVVTIATPFNGAPLISCLSDHPPRYQQMSEGSNFLRNLQNEAYQLEKMGATTFYSIGSTMDPMVPNYSSIFASDPRNQYIYKYLGHYALVAAPGVWLQMRSWFDKIYGIK